MSTSLKVPFINLDEQHQSMRAEIKKAIEPIFENASFILGPDVAQFEKDFASFCQAQHCVTLHSGTAAIQLALMALDVGPGDEVITAPNSFIATAEGISFVGATPTFVDVDAKSHTLDATKLEAAITPKTKAIIPVHLYGQPADMDAIMEIANRHGIKVIEDACQAHGALYKGRPVGTFGQISCFSFYPGKNLGAAGDGGAICTNDAALAKRVKMIRDHGSVVKYEHEIIGHNFRLDTIQAAVLNVKLKYLSSWNKSRRAAGKYYSEQLRGVPDVIVPEEMGDRTTVCHLYVLRVPNRAELQKELTAKNIQSGIHYPTPIHLQKAYEFLGYKKGDYPVSELLCDEVLSLPMYPDITREQQDAVIAVIRDLQQSRVHEQKQTLTTGTFA